MPLRILQIVPAVSPVYGGPSEMVLGFSKALAGQGAEVTLLTTNANGDRGQPPFDVPLQQSIAQDGYQILYFRCAPFRRYKFSVTLLQWLAAHATQFDIAHIHALFSPVSSAAAALARFKHLPYVLRPLGTLDPADLQKKHRLKQVYALLLERSNLAGAAAIHFTSQREAIAAHKFGVTTRDIILPLGVNAVEAATLQPGAATRTAWGIPPTIPVLLFLSRLDPKKGLDLLLPALETLLMEGVAFHFVLAGSNPQAPEYEAAIRSRIQESPLRTCTTITGMVSGSVKANLLHASDVFVLPSYYENFGIAVAEAMVAGLPVVISDQVALADEIASAQAGWVAPCQQSALTDCLRTVLKDPGERRQRGDRAQQLALNRYRWDAIAQQALELYQSLLHGTPKHPTPSL